MLSDTLWVKGFFPRLLDDQPERFAMTQALQLGDIHRIDPRRAEHLAQETFDGKKKRSELTEVIGELQEMYRL